MIFAINITAPTKTTDLYGRVAVHCFPMIIECGSVEDLRKKLSEQEKYISNLFRTKELYEQAVYYIRTMEDPPSEWIWPVPEVTKWIKD